MPPPLITTSLGASSSSSPPRRWRRPTPVWAATSLAVMEANGLELDHSASLTRGQTAQLLYQVSRMAVGAPGMAVFAMQE